MLPRVMKGDRGTPPSTSRLLHDYVRVRGLENYQPNGPPREQPEQQSPLSDLGAVLSRNPSPCNVHYSVLTFALQVSCPVGSVGRPR